MNAPDRNLLRLLREACPPVDPPAALEGRIRRAARARRAPGAALLRFLVPYAAGAVTVLGVHRSVPPAPPLPLAASAELSVPFASIADRAPPPPAEEPPAPVEVAYQPVPRIS